MIFTYFNIVKFRARKILKKRIKEKFILAAVNYEEKDIKYE